MEEESEEEEEAVIPDEQHMLQKVISTREIRRTKEVLCSPIVLGATGLCYEVFRSLRYILDLDLRSYCEACYIISVIIYSVGFMDHIWYTKV